MNSSKVNVTINIEISDKHLSDSILIPLTETIVRRIATRLSNRENYSAIRSTFDYFQLENPNTNVTISWDVEEPISVSEINLKKVLCESNILDDDPYSESLYESMADALYPLIQDANNRKINPYRDIISYFRSNYQIEIKTDLVYKLWRAVDYHTEEKNEKVS